MYIPSSKNKKLWQNGKKGQMFFSPKEAFNDHKRSNRKKLEPPEDMLIEEHSDDVLLQWKAPEFETFQRDKKWYAFITLILLAIISYALYTNSLIMAITFILIGVVGYIYVNKEPRILNFIITDDGVVAGREIYEFDNLKSFWIFYESHGIRVISLHTNSYLVPYVHIPIHDQDPVKIRKILLEHISEEKQEPGLTETIDRLIKL